MKNLKEILFTSLVSLSFVLFSLETRASENLEVVIIENSQMMKMEVKDPSMEEIDVYLFNNNNRQIFSKSVNLGETLETQFDFSGLKNGKYTLVSAVANMRVNRVIEVTENQVGLVDTYYSFVPEFIQKDGKLFVHYINDGAEDIGVSIESNRSIHYDTFYDNAELIFTKVYSLENLEAGTYKLQLISKSNFYAHEFEVN